MTKTTTRKQTLTQALALIRADRGLRDVTRSGLSGCPVGGWPETTQAIRRMNEALPYRSDRTYTVDDIIQSLYRVDAAGRYEYQG